MSYSCISAAPGWYQPAELSDNADCDDYTLCRAICLFLSCRLRLMEVLSDSCQTQGEGTHINRVSLPRSASLDFAYFNQVRYAEKNILLRNPRRCETRFPRITLDAF